MHESKHFELRVESANPEIRRLLTEALAGAEAGVSSRITEEVVYPGAFDSTIVVSIAVGVASNLVTKLLEKTLYPVLAEYTQRVFIDGHEITQLNLQNLEAAMRARAEDGRHGPEDAP